MNPLRCGAVGPFPVWFMIWKGTSPHLHRAWVHISRDFIVSRCGAFSLSTVETFFRGYCVSYHPDQFSAQSSNWNLFSFNGREIGLRCDGDIRLDNFCTPLSSVLTSFAGVPWAENLVLLYHLCTTRRFVSRFVLSFSDRHALRCCSLLLFPISTGCGSDQGTECTGRGMRPELQPWGLISGKHRYAYSLHRRISVLGGSNCVSLFCLRYLATDHGRVASGVVSRRVFLLYAHVIFQACCVLPVWLQCPQG
jgi:hypothetical protein